MRKWLSQLVMGVMVTVIGTVLANAIVGGKGRYGGDRGHFASSYKSHR